MKGIIGGNLNFYKNCSEKKVINIDEE